MAIDKKVIKEYATVVWAKVTGWLLAFASNLWEDYLKEKLQLELSDIIEKAVEVLKDVRASEEYIEKRDAIYDALFDKITLPAPLSWFKGVIKSILKSYVSGKVDKILGE